MHEFASILLHQCEFLGPILGAGDQEENEVGRRTTETPS